MSMQMNFGNAMRALKGGERVGRAGWNGKGMDKETWLESQPPDAHSKMTSPYVFISVLDKFTKDKKLVPWLALQTDILAEDWELVA